MSPVRRRLLVVNPNTDARVTQWLADEARRVGGAAFDITAVNARSGLAAIQSEADISIAADAVAAAIAAHPDASGAIVGAFGDPGVEAARASNLMPVVGLGGAGIAGAAKGGRSFSIVTLGEAMRQPIRMKARAMGLEAALADIRILPFSIPDYVADRPRHRAAIAAAVSACPDGAVLLGGAPFAGLALALAQETGRIVLDGVAACVEALST